MVYVKIFLLNYLYVPSKTIDNNKDTSWNPFLFSNNYWILYNINDVNKYIVDYNIIFQRNSIQGNKTDPMNVSIYGLDTTTVDLNATPLVSKSFTYNTDKITWNGSFINPVRNKFILINFNQLPYVFEIEFYGRDIF